ncbi:hypothetical protein BIY24_03495 [Halobacteriovorax marinus]|uniref:hypothetical protein n=1 Tax=Halobacteriovorax marinus TaxID=97084 RepID=UPI000BC310DA|nr:hypothetical protein [Halobacteriovorax marinus]ATH07032.1 hypothetical protein BIY24_03495 [Halobacteriovorax marinus]
MKVFTAFNETLPSSVENTSRKGARKAGPSKVKKSYRPPRENLSPEEIKARVASKTGANKKKVENLSGKQVSTFMSEDNAAVANIRTSTSTIEAAKSEKSEVKGEKNVLVNSDVQKNDPSDTNVHQKLKGLLNSGGFGWNDKERAALSEILGKD